MRGSLYTIFALTSMLYTLSNEWWLKEKRKGALIAQWNKTSSKNVKTIERGNVRNVFGTVEFRFLLAECQSERSAAISAWALFIGRCMRQFFLLWTFARKESTIRRHERPASWIQPAFFDDTVCSTNRSVLVQSSRALCLSLAFGQS